MKKLLISATVICFFLASVGLGTASARKAKPRPTPPTEPAGVVVDGRIALSALISLAELHIKKMRNSLELLAVTGEAQSGEWEKIKPLLVELERGITPSTLFFSRPDGSYYVPGMGLIPHNIKDRAYFSKVMAGETAVGELITSKSTGEKAVVVAVPVKRNNRVIGALGASIHLAALSQALIRDLSLPPDMVFYAIAEDGRAALSYRIERILEDPARIPNESLKNAIRRMLSVPQGMLEYDFHGKRRIIFQTSGLTGWRFALDTGDTR